MKIRAHLFVSGNVQGVFFRSEIKHEADKHHVKGWVRNLLDERVEAIFEGDKSDVKKLVEFCRTGPPAAKVTIVNVTWQPYLGEYNSFEIRY
jgi:acylphosphatase